MQFLPRPQGLGAAEGRRELWGAAGGGAAGNGLGDVCSDFYFCSEHE